MSFGYQVLDPITRLRHVVNDDVLDSLNTLRLGHLDLNDRSDIKVGLILISCF